MVKVDNENPNLHWEFVNVDGRIVLDLGCGRWEHIEHRDPNWPTTPEYWINKGASFSIGLDSDSNEINWFNDQFNDDSRYKFECMFISSTADMANLISTYNPDCIKCDIEGGESTLFDLDDDIFCKIDEYYIETHGDELYNRCIEKLTRNNYVIHSLIDLVHTQGFCKVVFARKK